MSPVPPVSVDASQVRLIWLQLAAAAVSPVGTAGTVLSTLTRVVVVEVLAIAVVEVTVPGAVTVRANVP